MTEWVYVDETKRAGYVLAVVTLTDVDATRRAVRELIVPGRRRLHMHNEHVRRRRLIVFALVQLPIQATIYDAARRYRTDREARAACLTALVADLAATGEQVRLVIEQDDTLVHTDRRLLFELTRRAAVVDRVRYEHQRRILTSHWPYRM